jgi:hypothetical protein
MICTHNLYVLTKRRRNDRGSFGYDGRCALDKRFYHSNGVSVSAEEGSNILIMGFSLTFLYNGLFKSFP